MTNEELKELCETWTEYLQCISGNTETRYFIRDDGQLMYETEDEDFFETTEKNLIHDINDTFDGFLQGKMWSWIQAEYIEEVLGIDYHSQQFLWLEIAEILNHMGSLRNEEFCRNKIKDKFRSVLQRADYLRQAFNE